MWSNQHEDIQNEVCKTFESVWYGIWNNGVYSVAKKADELDNPNLESITIHTRKYAVFSTDFGGFAGDFKPKLREQTFDRWLPNFEYTQNVDFIYKYS